MKFYNFDILNEDPEIYRLDKFSNSYQNEESYDYGTYNYKEQQGQAIQEHLDDIAAAFRSENYIIARSTARAALMQYPDDMGLLMIGSQAEFASEDYKQAATLLRKALTSQDIEKYGVPVPAQLYANDQVWAEQIDRLLEAVLDDKTNPELNLLLGYQLFASGDIEISKEFLNKAVLDHINRRSARVLLDTFNSAEQAGDLGEKK